MTNDRDYVLGTHDEEIARLGLQHRVWRPRALEAWRDAGFTTGQTIVDLGCGPGWAALDLAEIAGEVVAIDRSRRFLDALEARNAKNIRVVEADLDLDALPAVEADGVWIRWVLAFVKQPRELLRKAVRLLKRGGTIVMHEYFDYRTWRFAPRSELFERFVVTVMESWRAEGGEADIALELPHWLGEEGLDIVRTRPIIDVISPRSFVWQWPASFVKIGLDRMVELGRIDRDQATRTAQEFERRGREASTLMITPAVLEIIARKG